MKSFFRFFMSLIFLSLLFSCSTDDNEKKMNDFSEKGILIPMNPSGNMIAVNINIDAHNIKQSIDGFGAAGAWWAQDVGGWDNEKRTYVADLLFDSAKGIGLSIYRYNIGGGDGKNIQDTWRRAETFEIAPSLYDWAKDANAVWMLRAARDREVPTFVAFVNSPPGRMTISGLTTGEKNGKSNLSPEMYEEYSQYLVDVVRHLQNDLGVPIKYLSPINEPQWNWNYQNGQEGCHYGPDEVVALTKVLLATIRENQLPVQLSLFESGEWKSSDVYIEKLADDPEVWASLPHISIHSYWSTRADKIRFMNYMEKNHPEKPLWMSEWTEMVEGRDTGIESALVLADTINDDLTITNVTSWQYWIAVSKYQFHDGLIYVNPINEEIIPTKRLWAMGNYSRFIRPGFLRIESSEDSDFLQASIFESEDSKTWIMVVINHSTSPVNLSFNVKNGTLPSLQEKYETSENSDLEKLPIGDQDEIWIVNPKSITTFVLKR